VQRHPIFASGGNCTVVQGAGPPRSLRSRVPPAPRAGLPRPFSLFQRGRKLRGNDGIWTGAVLLTVGLSVVLLVGEWLAALDSCLANPICAPVDSVSTLEGYFGLMIVGVALAVGGGVLLLVSWLGPARAAQIKTPTS
jgi:hypothetical protein